MNEGAKEIKCKNCKTEFEPFYRNGIIISRLCCFCLAKGGKKKIQQKAKEDLKTHKDWLSDLQKVFNEYIRLRDKNSICISCGCSLNGKFDAGHYFSVGAYPELRFNEDNVHGQCVHCNQHKHGNISEYSLSLPLRIGQERFDKLLELRNNKTKLSVEEIKEKIAHYKQLIKQMKDGTIHRA